MEVILGPDLEEKLHQEAGRAGIGAGEFVRDLVASYMSELAETRSLLSRRYDDLASGRVQPIDGDEALRHFQAKSAARRAGTA